MRRGTLTDWIAAGCLAAVVVLVALDATADRVIAGPGGHGWTKPAIARATAEYLGLGWLCRPVGPDNAGGDD